MRKAISFILCLAILSVSLLIPASAYSIKLINPPDKTVFYEGSDWAYNGSVILPKSDFKLTGAVVNYNDEEIVYTVFPWGGNMIAEPDDGTWNTGKNVVRIYLDDFDNVYVLSELTLVAIKSITLVNAPTKTTLVSGVDWEYDSKGYIQLKKFSAEGSKIKVNYTDGTTKTIAYADGGIDWRVPASVSDFNLGKNTFELTYASKAVSFPVNFVKEGIVSASIASNPTKTTYNFENDWVYSGDKISVSPEYSGLRVKLTYQSGKTETVAYSTASSRFKFKLPSAFAIGKNTIGVSVDGSDYANFAIQLRGYGDINFDGEINSSDSLLILQSSVGMTTLSRIATKYADVTDDKEVNSSDALAILQRSVGQLKFFKAEL